MKKVQATSSLGIAGQNLGTFMNVHYSIGKAVNEEVEGIVDFVTEGFQGEGRRKYYTFNSDRTHLACQTKLQHIF